NMSVFVSSPFLVFRCGTNGKSRWHSGGLLVVGCGLLVVDCWFWVRMLIEDLTVYLSKIPKTHDPQPTTIKTPH
ncbi:MAG: hypothetical protein MR386_09925, partial [Prevotella sp.]|nr:hypothetical protein [Prevotella sp.]